MDSINYKLDLFEGPLELLLTLVSKNKMKIDDIPIDILCDQYMEYIHQATDNKIDLACEFLYMASELMLIKSRMLLPRDENDGDDPRRPLIDAILEYQKAKLAASELSEHYLERMIKEQDDISADRTYVSDHSVELLSAALIHVLSDVKISNTNIKEKFIEIVSAPRIPVEDVITNLIDTLRNDDIYLDEYFTKSSSRQEVIAKFISILELLKMHIISMEEPEIENQGVTNILTHIKIKLIASEEDIKSSSLDYYS